MTLVTSIQLIAQSNSQTTRNIIPHTAGLILLPPLEECVSRGLGSWQTSTPSPAVRLNRADSMESSYHLFRSEPAAARILRGEVSLKIYCLGSGKVSDRTEPTRPQGATRNQAQHWWLNRCLLNNQEGSNANQQIHPFSRLLIWHQFSNRNKESMAAETESRCLAGQSVETGFCMFLS